MLDKANPRLALVEYPCTPWTIMQRNCNYRHRLDELEERQDADRPFLKLTGQVFDSQVARGAHAIAENPATADSQQSRKYFAYGSYGGRRPLACACSASRGRTGCLC